MNSSVRIDLGRLEAYVVPLVEAAVRSGTHPSAVVAVANSRETLWTHVSPGRDNIGLESIFAVGSIAKPVTATAVMRLVEQGKLRLDAPVALYLPELGSGDKASITTRHLLTHSSGIDEGDLWVTLQALQAPPPPDYLFELCCRAPLQFQPGTAYSYNSLAFSVLSELVERIERVSFTEYVRRDILAPLGMSGTAFHPVDRARAAPIYDFGPPETLEGFISMVIPGGGLWSTAADLVTFGQTYLRGGSRGDYQLISPAAIIKMTRHYTPGATQLQNGVAVPFNYALGWGKPSPDGDLLASESAFGHGGITGTRIWIDPEYDLVYVFLTNRWGMESIGETLLNAVYGAVV